MRILLLSRYGMLGASSRVRAFQYLSTLNKHGIEVDVSELIDDISLSYLYKQGRYNLLILFRCFYRRLIRLLSVQKYDLLWIEKEVLPFWPLWIEKMLLNNIPYVLDYDDAVFHVYDRHQNRIIRWFFGKRLDRLMAKANLVVCGNNYLSQRALIAGAQRVKILPTVVDLERYRSPDLQLDKLKNDSPKIVWIGSPSTVRYLKVIEEALQVLASKISFKLRVIGADYSLPGVQVECFCWSDSTEVDLIRSCDVGVMPLFDSHWERGKCGYKLVQYMACGLPSIASPIGINSQIIRDGVNGFLCRDSQSWIQRLDYLLSQPRLREVMGHYGREHIKRYYSLEYTSTFLVSWFLELANKN